MRNPTDGLREFIEVDNERALDVGALRRGTGTLQVRKPKVLEGGSDVIVRESPDELTSRAEEVDTSKALIDVNRIEPERWSPLLVDADWCEEIVDQPQAFFFYENPKIRSKYIFITEKIPPALKAKCLFY